jgi:hypothetical protein
LDFDARLVGDRDPNLDFLTIFIPLALARRSQDLSAAQFPTFLVFFTVATATSLTTRAVCLAAGVAILRARRALLLARVIIPLLLERPGVRLDPPRAAGLFEEERDLLADLPLECLTIFGGLLCDVIKFFQIVWVAKILLPKQ